MIYPRAVYQNEYKKMVILTNAYFSDKIPSYDGHDTAKRAFLGDDR